jgi:hypothetical protein
MKFLAPVQIVLGALTSFTSWKLIEMKAHSIANPLGNGIWVDARPPNFHFEIVLLFFGLAILSCGFFQFKTRIKYAGLQIISGLFTAIIFAYFSIRAATKGYGEVDSIYYVAYLPLIAGLVVFITGFVQLVTAIINRSTTVQEEPDSR